MGKFIYEPGFITPTNEACSLYPHSIHLGLEGKEFLTLWYNGVVGSEVVDWIEENCVGTVWISDVERWFFSFESDMLAFKLRWL